MRHNSSVFEAKQKTNSLFPDVKQVKEAGLGLHLQSAKDDGRGEPVQQDRLGSLKDKINVEQFPESGGYAAQAQSGAAGLASFGNWHCCWWCVCLMLRTVFCVREQPVRGRVRCDE